MRKSGSEATPVTEELALLVESVQDYAIFLLGPTGDIRSWNNGAGRIMGYTADEILGQSFSKFYTEEDLKARKPQRELEQASAENRVEDEGWRVRRDGRRFWANTVITAMRDPKGEVTGFAKVTRDLTERRKAEEQLRQNEELFRLLVSSVTEYAMFMLDPEGRVATWNAGAHRIKGYTADEIIGRHFSAFYTDEDRQAQKPERKLALARQNGVVEDEGWRLRKDGTRFWANVVITAVHDESGTLRGFAKVTRDITDRKKAEETRQSLFEQREALLKAEQDRRVAEASYEAAVEANRAKDAFLMTLSHELRTPMTAILGWSRLLPAMPHDDAAFKNAIEAIGRSAELQAKLIDDVLDVSRIVSGKLRLSRDIVQVEQVLRAAVESVRAMADARSITIVTSIGPEVGQILADPTRLQQILWNLLTNAVKFTPNGGRVEIHAQRTLAHLEITIKDNGEGIEPAFLVHVFEPFRQAENPRTRVHGGLGLGLSIVRYLVEAHGGRVTAQSAGRGKGATLCVQLPIVMAAGEERLSNATPSGAPIVPHHLRNLKVLIVDDDRDTRAFVQATLQSAGAKVRAADSAAAALEQFQNERPDLILTDIAMPGLDGYEFARTIRESKNGANVKIVALTAFPADPAAAERSGLDGYLVKPIAPARLIESLAVITTED